MNKIVITKKIAKQGENRIIVIPKYLHQSIDAGDVVQIEITKLYNDKED